MSIATILILILFIVYLTGCFLYLTRIYKQEIRKISFVYFTMLLIFPILIINSSIFIFTFDENISYFQDLWIWFSLIGIFLFAGGIRIMQIANQSFKTSKNDKLEFSTTGIFKVMRHPHYTALFLMYNGLAIVLDSLLGILFLPFFAVMLEIIANLEEKKVLLRKFKGNYQKYIKKTPFKIFPNPYNYILIIVIILIFYVGFLNLVS